MRCGGAAATVASAVNATAVARTNRFRMAVLEPLAMHAMSHRFGQSAIGMARAADEQPFSQSVVCRVLLEVLRAFHDIRGSDRALRPRKGDQMANWQDPQATGVGAATVSVPRAARDVGLRSYMLSVYNYMASRVLLTGIVALLFANSSLINLIATVNPATGHVQATPPGLITMFAPLALVFVLSLGINRISAGAAQALYWV